MTLIDFCQLPRTMYELEAEGFTRGQVFGAVNQNPADAFGRVKKGAGLFTVAVPVDIYDAAPLVDAWR